MLRKGTRTLILAFIAGILVGGGIHILHYIEAQASLALSDLLQDEVKKSCSCELKYDSLNTSLLSLTAVGKNLRITENGVDKLKFKKLTGSFSLKEIWQKNVIIEHLDFYDGFADEVDQNSVTFRFIDQLTTSPPPEKQRPDRWHVILKKLNIYDSRISQSIAGAKLEAEGVSLDLERTNDGDFTLTSKISRLFLDARENPRMMDVLPTDELLYLGTAVGSVTLRERRTDFTSITVSSKAGNINFSGYSLPDKHNALSGKLKYSVDTSKVFKVAPASGTITGEAAVSGFLGEPLAEGTIDTLPESPIHTIIPFLRLQSIKAQYQGDLKTYAEKFTLHNGSATGADIQIDLSQPLVITSKEIHGGFDITLNGFALDSNILFPSGKIRLGINGKPNSPTLAFHGNIDRPTVSNIPLPSVDFEGTLIDGILDLKGNNNKTDFGIFNAAAKFDLFSTPTSTEATIEGSIFPLSAVNPALSNFNLATKLSLKGPLNLQTIAVDGQYEISASNTDSHFLAGNLAIVQGLLKANGTDRSGKVDLEVLMPLTPTEFEQNLGVQPPAPTGKVNLKVNKLSLGEYDPRLNCSTISLNSTYTFSPFMPKVGNGEVNLTQFDFGCTPYQLTLPNQAQIDIRKGEFLFSSLNLTGPDSSLKVDGKVNSSGELALALAGQLELSTFLPLFPKFDEAQGSATLDAKLLGSLSAPKIDGFLKIQDAEIISEESDLNATEIEGRLNFHQEKVTIEELKGRINTGTFSASGNIILTDMANSEIKFRVRDFALEPAADLSLSLSADLSISLPDQKTPLISGEISVDGAEYQKDITLVSLLQELPRRLFGSVNVENNGTVATQSAPSATLDLKVKANSSLYLITNFAVAELKGNGTLKGPVAAPEFSMTLETLSGWFGFRGHQFEITTGTAILPPGSLSPELNIVGETYVRSREGDNALVILEIKGPLSRPKTVLSSDRGLSERDILSLITYGTQASTSTRSNAVGSDFKATDSYLLSKETFSGLGGFLSNLTRIDSLAIEPLYNRQTGTLEPAVIAQKWITDSVSITSENFLSSNAAGAEFSAGLDLTDRLNLSGNLSTVGTNGTGSLGVDLTYTVLASRKDFIQYQFAGNDNLSKHRLLTALRLDKSSRIVEKDLERIKKNLLALYAKEGFLDTEAELRCEGTNSYCKRLSFKITEGQQSKISEIHLTGDLLPQNVNFQLDKVIGLRATPQLLEIVSVEAVNALRSEGFISARVSPSFQRSVSQNKPEQKILQLNLSVGRAVTFLFQGNKNLTEQELLETINFFKRKQPFGTNTINLLVENIERAYRAKGHLYAVVQSEKLADGQDQRVTYRIAIDEGPRITVDQITLTPVDQISNESFDLQSLRSWLELKDAASSDRIFNANYALQEEIHANCELIRETLHEHGFSAAFVEGKITPTANGTSVDITYNLHIGAKDTVEHLEVIGLPEFINQPEVFVKPLTASKVNKGIEEVCTELQRNGFYYFSIMVQQKAAEPDQDDGVLQIVVTTGAQTKINKIMVAGNERIETEEIIKNLHLEAGDPLTEDRLLEAKRSLLTLGLFSRINISTQKFGEEANNVDLLVSVVERPLQSLEVGAGLDSTRGLHLFGEAIERSIFRDGRSLSLRFDTFFNQTASNNTEGSAALQYRTPRIFDTPWRFNEELRFQNLDLKTLEYNNRQVALSSIFTREYPNQGSITFGHSLEQDHVTNVSPGAILTDEDEGTSHYSSLLGSLAYDRRDDQLNPADGYFLALEDRLALQGIGSEESFNSVTIKGSLVKPLDQVMRYSIGLSIRGGYALPFDGTEQIPITHRYYLGGRNTVRGFKENSLGPRGNDGAVIGGDTFLMSNAELRYRITDNFQLLSFYDMGTLWLRDFESANDELRKSAGFGFRYISPIGPIGFDIGHPLNRHSGEPLFVVHFSVGSNL